MARPNLLLLLLPALLSAGSTGRPASSTNLGGIGGEKLTHLRFFFHDIVSGPQPTVVTVASGASTNTSATFFGLVSVFDDPLTVGPKPTSQLVGRAQGLYASAAQDSMGLLMVMNFVFVNGKFNGSTLTILGRNQIFTKLREMPILGGTKAFRFARGYVQARTHSFDLVTKNAVVEYNCYVLHIDE
ncbi:hypothetical protein HPP92_002734 [Vanilla planifolia]|uniref:Dirigent protein n=1 Tax=Vanilla planifolia TaxID=51239 RepID=A0A835SEA7_VANPL|nr:hypothetical protein HPP92_002734 [Vanilla planifolia]